MLFDHPGMLLDIQPTGKELSGGVAIGTLAIFGGVSEHLAEGAVSFVPQRRSATSFELGRILAKISHSYAVAELGVGGFTPFLQPIIMGKDTKILDITLAGRQRFEEIADFYQLGLKEVDTVSGVKPLMVTIRIFADMQGMPEYWIVVGNSIVSD